MREKDTILDYPELTEVFLALRRLPGLGPRSARKLAVHLAENQSGKLANLISVLENLSRGISRCRECSVICAGELCWRCADDDRKNLPLCVIENHLSMFAIEEAKVFEGNFHLLGGTLPQNLTNYLPDNWTTDSSGQGAGIPAPANSYGKLMIDQLVDRVAKNSISEVILAFDYTYEGQLTSDYLYRILVDVNSGIRITRLGSGIPVGGELTYADEGTLKAAFLRRTRIE